MRAAGLILALLALAALPAGASAKTPRCFGAADRDPQVPCKNPKLRLKVRPTPNRALEQPNRACTRVHVDETFEQCAYGAPADAAVETVVMLGDSHAAHWRAALDVAARAKGWRVLESATPHCPFSRAVPKGPGEDWCPAWNDKVLAWLGEHPEVRTVLASAHTRAPIVVPEGKTEFQARLDGFAAIWSQLPASVERVIHIRDNPLDRLRTHDCVRRAIRKRRPAGRRCAVERRQALADDAAIPAAQQTTARPVHVVDLTPHFCTATRCLPVVGGVLVHKDVDHLTQLFSRTLGPYLLRGIGAAFAPA